MEMTTIHLDMVQSVALAIVSYYIGTWIKGQSVRCARHRQLLHRHLD